MRVACPIDVVAAKPARAAAAAPDATTARAASSDDTRREMGFGADGGSKRCEWDGDTAADCVNTDDVGVCHAVLLLALSLVGVSVCPVVLLLALSVVLLVDVTVAANVSDGVAKGACGMGRFVHSMRTRLLARSAKITFPCRSIAMCSGLSKRAWCSGTLSTKIPGVLLRSLDGPEPAIVLTLPLTRIMRTRCS